MMIHARAPRPLYCFLYLETMIVLQLAGGAGCHRPLDFVVVKLETPKLLGYLCFSPAMLFQQHELEWPCIVSSPIPIMHGLCLTFTLLGPFGHLRVTLDAAAAPHYAGDWSLWGMGERFVIG